MGCPQRWHRISCIEYLVPWVFQRAASRLRLNLAWIRGWMEGQPEGRNRVCPIVLHGSAHDVTSDVVGVTADSGCAVVLAPEGVARRGRHHGGAPRAPSALGRPARARPWSRVSCGLKVHGVFTCHGGSWLRPRPARLGRRTTGARQRRRPDPRATEPWPACASAPRWPCPSCRRHDRLWRHTNAEPGPVV